MPASSSRFCRSLQVFAVLQWLFLFLGLSQVCLALLILALLSRAWILGVLYLVWLYGDRNTPQTGGRRSAWVRNWAIWRHFRDYFPISLVKTAELDPSHNYLFGFHPHGVLVIGAFSNFCTEATGFSRLFPGFRPHLLMLPFWFHLPVFRDCIMLSGLVSSAKASIAYLLSRPGGGQVAVLAVGGPLEALEAKPGALSLRIRNQKGFVKLALEHGASLVPVFSFGENDVFQQVPNPPGSWLRMAQEALQPLLRLSLPLFHGRLGPLPFRSHICTVVGAPIQVRRSPRPGRAQVDALHALYVERLTQLFEEHKARYGVPADQHLILT
ncbi:2-acylglycerol O-acyltransferase 2-like isoform X1 [Pipistrellus kuhlii]|uniref:2-acylglycerol O-acyltransferase 2-like isoform X1 n=1 Tax=Pipistrellus kuhlii TaxID=59472 RepID=UPI00174F19DF|nr:2-acylglycerol O-acyltransferase 2-like isoform X1 [Pipistrellus kuhlii]